MSSAAYILRNKFLLFIIIASLLGHSVISQAVR